LNEKARVHHAAGPDVLIAEFGTLAAQAAQTATT
jgi:hypothetical protein